MGRNVLLTMASLSSIIIAAVILVLVPIAGGSTAEREDAVVLWNQGTYDVERESYPGAFVFHLSVRVGTDRPFVTFITGHTVPPAMGRVRMGLSTPAFVNTIDEFLERTAREGWDFAEFNHLDLPPFSPELLDGAERERVRGLAGDLGLEVTLHAGDCDLLTLDPGFLRYSKERLRTEAQLARDLDAVYLNSHVGFPERMVRPGRSLWADEHFDFQARVEDAVRHLAGVADGTGVRILYENTYRLIDPLMEAVNECASPLVGFLLDVGHANLAGGIRRLHAIMSSRGKLFAMHLHDNNGKWDDHAPPGSGTVDLEGVDLPGYVAVEVRNWAQALGTREEFRKRYL